MSKPITTLYAAILRRSGKLTVYTVGHTFSTGTPSQPDLPDELWDEVGSAALLYGWWQTLHAHSYVRHGVGRAELDNGGSMSGFV